MKKYPLLLSIVLIVCTLQANAQNSETQWDEEIAVVVGTLDSTVAGTSSLFIWNNELWTSNDHGTFAMHQLDLSTAKSNQVLSEELTFKDMEEVAQDDRFFYFGDFGNNSSRLRQDLRILRLDKDAWNNGNCHFDTIKFTYHGYNPNGESSKGLPTTDFDCEAMVAVGDSLYLFTKQWTSQQTVCYRLPKEPGSYTAMPMFRLNVDGLVTGACYFERAVNRNETKSVLMLCGYSLLVQPFVYVIYNFTGTDFYHGDRLKIHFSDIIGLQTEGITTHNGLHYWTTNEEFNRMGVNHPAELRMLDLTEYLHDYLYPDNSSTIPDLMWLGVDSPDQSETLTLSPNPTNGLVKMMSSSAQIHDDAIAGKIKVEVLDTQGRAMPVKAEKGWIDLRGMASGTYIVRMTTPRGNIITRQVILRARK